MTGAPTESASRTRWAAVAAAFATGIICGFYVGKMPSALPLMKAEFGLSLVTTGWVMSMFNVVAMAGAVIFGLAADRIGALRINFAGLASLLAGGLLATFAASSMGLLVARALEGLGFVAIVVSAPALILTATHASQRGLVLGIWSIYMPAGASVALAANPYLLPQIGWRGVWLAVALLTVLVIAMVAFNRGAYDGLARGRARSAREVAHAITRPMPFLLGAAFALYALQMFAIMTWLPTYLAETRGIGLHGAAFATAAFVAANMTGCIVGGFLVHRNIGRGKLFGVTFAILGALTVVILAVPIDAIRFAAVLSLSAIAGVIPAASLSGAARYAESPGETGIVQGLVVQVANLGNLLGPPLAALVVEWTGRWDAIPFLLLAATGLGLVVAGATALAERSLARGRAV